MVLETAARVRVIHSITEMQRHVGRLHAAGRRLVLVPTMGALHRGHLELVREAFRQGDEVIVSVFVNPVQFGPEEDYVRYPRTLEDDLGKLAALGSDVTVFTPKADEMYPAGAASNRTWIVVEELDRHLCGRHRHSHFRGVATIVAKLLIVCRPHTAVFGLKDAQQFVILKRMILDLCFDVEIVGVETVREPDGLACSTRNEYLNPPERTQAVVLYQAIREAERMVLEGEQAIAPLVEAMRMKLAQAPDLRTQYVEVVDAETLQPVDVVSPGGCVLAAVAAFFRETRLIDSVFVRAPTQ